MPQIKVICAKDSFWRGGHRWTREPQTVDTENFTPLQLEQIGREPLLTVTLEADVETPPTSLADAIAKLLSDDPQKQNESWWTRDGKPEVGALTELTGARVSAKERDAAWEAAQPAT